MRKTILLIILLFLLLPNVLGQIEIQYSTDNSTWRNITNVNEETTEGYQTNLQSDTLYFFRGRNDTSRWNYFTQRTKEGPEAKMASLAITLFILMVTGTLFLLPFFKNFTKHEFTNMILKRSCWIISVYLMMLNASIMATIADNVGLNVTQEMFRYMWLFGRVGYGLMIFLVFMTVLDGLKLWKLKKETERFGET